VKHRTSLLPIGWTPPTLRRFTEQRVARQCAPICQFSYCRLSSRLPPSNVVDVVVVSIGTVPSWRRRRVSTRLSADTVFKAKLRERRRPTAKTGLCPLIVKSWAVWQLQPKVVQAVTTWLVWIYLHTQDMRLQGGPKKVSHYREPSLNRINNRQPG